MYPSFHQDVSNAVSDEIDSPWFNENEDDEDSNNEYRTNIIGRFRCKNNSYSKDGWSSGKVAIRIRGYPEYGYNVVVYNQRCKSCNGLGTLTPDKDSYVERVAYRLKKWAGFQTEERQYVEKTTPPHKRELCEGCKQGVCRG